MADEAKPGEVVVELTEVERLAWDGLMREQREALALAQELRRGGQMLGEAGLARAETVLRDRFRALDEEQVGHGKTLSAAIARSHGLAPPEAAPRLVVDGKTWRLAWAVSGEAKDVSAAEPVVLAPVVRRRGPKRREPVAIMPLPTAADPAETCPVAPPEPPA